MTEAGGEGGLLEYLESLRADVGVVLLFKVVDWSLFGVRSDSNRGIRSTDGPPAAY